MAAEQKPSLPSADASSTRTLLITLLAGFGLVLLFALIGFGLGTKSTSLNKGGSLSSGSLGYSQMDSVPIIL